MDDPDSAPPPVAAATRSPQRPPTEPPPVISTGSACPGLPGLPPSRLDRLRAPLLTAGLVAGLTIALHVRDPHDPGSWGECPWLALTGQYCPGCGGLRAVNDLSNGDVVGAASSNLLFLAMVPVLVVWWLVWFRRSWVGAGPPAGQAPQPAVRADHPGRWIAALIVVMVVFTVLRNLSLGSWLAP
jgi:hypothetical protein